MRCEWTREVETVLLQQLGVVLDGAMGYLKGDWQFGGVLTRVVATSWIVRRNGSGGSERLSGPCTGSGKKNATLDGLAVVALGLPDTDLSVGPWTTR